MFVPKRVNSFKLVFNQNDAEIPSETDLLNFIKLNFHPNSVMGFYFDEQEHNYVIKFNSIAAKNRYRPGVYGFTYISRNNQQTKVTICEAGDYIRMFRVLNVPLDVENNLVQDVLINYGTVIDVKYELIGDDDWKICNGNRQCLMRLDKGMPDTIIVDEFKVKIVSGTAVNVDAPRPPIAEALFESPTADSFKGCKSAEKEKSPQGNSDDLNESDSWLELIERVTFPLPLNHNRNIRCYTSHRGGLNEYFGQVRFLKNSFLKSPEQCE